MAECSITAALTGLALQRCCHVRLFFPSKIKSCTALQGRFAVVHFLPNCKTVSPSKQLSPKHYSLCAPCQTADQISLFFFFGVTVPAYFGLESTFTSYKNLQR